MTCFDYWPAVFLRRFHAHQYSKKINASHVEKLTPEEQDMCLTQENGELMKMNVRGRQLKDQKRRSRVTKP